MARTFRIAICNTRIASEIAPEWNWMVKSITGAAIRKWALFTNETPSNNERCAAHRCTWNLHCSVFNIKTNNNFSCCDFHKRYANKCSTFIKAGGNKPSANRRNLFSERQIKRDSTKLNIKWSRGVECAFSALCRFVRFVRQFTSVCRLHVS